MKILLLGEYSGFHRNLKEGLMELGHDCHIATAGDDYKKICSTDLYFPNSRNKYKRRLQKMAFPFTRIRDYYNYDIVQLVNSDIFEGTKFGYNYFLIKKIYANTEKMIMSSCGTDYFVFKNKDTMRYNPFDAAVKYDSEGFNRYNSKGYIKNNVSILDMVEGIIPNTYTYANAYRWNNKLLKTIPFPININNIKFVPQKIENNKIKIFHGLNREGFKGTKYIREAMEKLKKSYPNDVEIIIDGKMPLKDYLKILAETNVVVDQALSYSYGMNAIYSMAMGKVVLGGNEPECQKEFGRNDIPVINITPSIDDIYNKLENLVLNKKSVIEIGQKSRLFVEDFHHHVKVAQQYIDTWNSAEVKK